MAFRNLHKPPTLIAENQYRISSHPESHILVIFEDQFGQSLFTVDSNSENVPGVLRHTVTVSISKTTAAITIREILALVGPLDVTLPRIAALALTRRSFSLVKIGTEQNGTTGDETFCILMSLQPHTLNNSSIAFTIPRNEHLPYQKLDFENITRPLASVRSIKVCFAIPWGNNDLKPELVKLMLRPRAPGPVPPPTNQRPSSNSPSYDLNSLGASPSPRTANRSVASRHSVEATRSENATSHSIEEDARVRELEERVREQAEENEKNNKRMQDLEDLIRGQVQIKSKEGTDNGDSTVTRKIQQASPLQRTQDPRLAANLSRNVVLENHAQEVLGYAVRIKELEQIVDNKSECIQDLEAEVRTQAELVTILKEECRLRDGPDIAALGAELAFARGVDRGDRAGVEARLPSARLSGEVVGRLVQNSVFRSSFLGIPEKRGAHSEEGEVRESDEESDDGHSDKKIKIEGMEGCH